MFDAVNYSDHYQAVRKRLGLIRRPPVARFMPELKPVPKPVPKPAAEPPRPIEPPQPDWVPEGQHIAQIQRAIAEAHGITIRDMVGRSRTSRLVRIRQHAMWATKQRFPTISLPRMGRAFGRDHTTVLHGIRRHQALVDGRQD